MAENFLNTLQTTGVYFYSVTTGLEDVSKYPSLFAELIRRKWADNDLRKLAGKNLVRVFRQVEKVCHQSTLVEINVFQCFDFSH